MGRKQKWAGGHGKGRAKKQKMKRRELYDETDYEFKDGMRHVIPYPYEFRTHAKERWYGRGLFDVFCKEFGSNTPAYFSEAIKDGRITIEPQGGCSVGNTNRTNVEPEYEIARGDCLVHVVHRHEPPVLADPIVVVHESPSVLVVSKPPSLPVHPCGAYRYNSLTCVLNREIKRGLSGGSAEILTVHRLDRLTSGLVQLLLRVPL